MFCITFISKNFLSHWKFAKSHIPTVVSSSISDDSTASINYRPTLRYLYPYTYVFLQPTVLGQTFP